jgi:hypothetical protein
MVWPEEPFIVSLTIEHDKEPIFFWDSRCCQGRTGGEGYSSDFILSVYSLKPDGCLVRIIIRHLSIVKNRAQKGSHWNGPSWLYVRPAKKCARVNYVFVDRGLLMGAKLTGLWLLNVCNHNLHPPINACKNRQGIMGVL